YHPLALLPPGRIEWKTVWHLLTRRYDFVVYLRGSFPFLLLGVASPIAAAKFVPGEPVVRRYVKALEPFLGPLSDPQPTLRVPDKARRLARTRLQTAVQRRGPHVVIHPAASGSTKEWPLDRYATVAAELRASGACVHFVGSAGEGKRLAKALSDIGQTSGAHFGLPLAEV